jgi:large subunit ribosomal protein L21
MYAVIQTGGKQYRANEKDVLRVEKLEGSVGDEVKLDRILLVGDGGSVRVGRPFLEGVTVTARVKSQGRGKKIHGFTYKKVKNEHRRYGHRQSFTEIVIEKIQAPSAKRRSDSDHGT